MPNDVSYSGLVASGDLSTRQFYAVRMSLSSGQAFEVSAISSGGGGHKPIGILQDNPNSSGVGANVLYSGQSKVRLGGNVTQGDLLSNDSFGRLIGISLGLGSSGPNSTGQWILGQALQSGNTTAVIFAMIHPAYLVQGSS